MWCRIVEDVAEDPTVFEFPEEQLYSIHYGLKPDLTKYIYLAKETSPENTLERVLFFFKYKEFQVHMFQGFELVRSCKGKVLSYTVDDSLGFRAEHFQIEVTGIL